MQRRHFIKSSAATAATAATAALAAASAGLSAQDTGADAFIDTNVYLGRWPFRRLPHDEPGRLAANLRRHGITEAWAGSFDALLHRDLDQVNTALTKICKSHDLFRPIGAVNPKLPGWRETLRRCAENHRMRGIRLHPNYHGYTLDDMDFAALLGEARERGLLVQIALRMEDTRTQHPQVAVPDVDPAPIVPVLKDLRGTRVQLLNGLRTVTNSLLLQRLGKLNVRVDLAMLEGMEGIRRFLEHAPGTSLAFGSYAPFFYFESALLKLRESELSEAELAAIRSDSALELLET